MNGYSLNRASLNGSVIAFIAGAALISSSGNISATGLCTVNPEVLQIAASGSIGPTGTRVAMGSADAFSNSTISVFPGLLFVSSAKFHMPSCTWRTKYRVLFPGWRNAASHWHRHPER